MNEAEINNEIDALPSGARFHRADLHIHSLGASHDVRDASMTPEAIVKMAVAENLAVIALTDHNNISNVKAAQDAASATGLVVIPGVELSLPEGHLLVYFSDLEALSDFVGGITIVDRDNEKSRCQNSMLDCLKRIDTSNGFAVLAHVDGDGGLEAKVPGNPPSKADILCHSALLGMELKAVTSPISYSVDDPDADRARIAKARQEALGLGSRQFLGRVLFSDSHDLEALGRNARGDRRVTRVKMATPSFESLRVAFLDGDARLRIEDEIPEAIPYVKGIRMEGGFLDAQAIHFSKNLTCIIGGRGAGKSTAFEVVKCVSPRGSESKLVDCDIWPDLLNVIWMDQAGQSHTLARRIGEEVENLSDPEQGADVMSVESYSQGEGAKTSVRAQSDPSALLDFLDQFINPHAQKEQENQILEELLANQTEIEKATLKVRQIPDTIRFQRIARQRLSALEAAKARDIVALERKVAEERVLREEIEEANGELLASASGSLTEEALSSIRELATAGSLKVGETQRKVILGLVKKLEGVTEKSEENLGMAVEDFFEKVKAQLGEWRTRERKIVDKIETKRKALLVQGVKLDLSYIRKLAQDEASYTKTLSTLRAWDKHLGELKKTRRELLKKRWEFRAKIFAVRDAYARRASKMLEGALGDLSVSIKFEADAYSTDAEELIQQAMGWKTVQVPRAALLVRQLTVPKLLDAIRRKDPAPIVALKTKEGVSAFNRGDARDVIGRLGEESNRHGLERVEIEDATKINVTKRVKMEDGPTRHITRVFSKLSLGQQQWVLLTLMLSSESNEPLIIDQPEDNLDGEFIYHCLVPALRRAKERRQIIVVTHNANIAVLGDAEQIVVLKSLSDKGRIVARGSIDDPGTRSMACSILEGAEEAFRRRANIYGIK